MSESADSMAARLEQCRLELAAARDDADNLQRAIESNRRIGMALGIVMERYKITGDAAFDVLRRLSMDLNRRLADVADDVLHTGVIPRPRSPRRRADERNAPGAAAERG